MASLSMTDAQGRILVRVTLDGRASFKDTRKGMKAAVASLSITAVDKNYRGGTGVMNAYVDLGDVSGLVTGARGRGRDHGAPPILQQDQAWNRRSAGSRAQRHGGRGDDQARHGLRPGCDPASRRPDQSNITTLPATLDLEGQGMQIACISNSFNAHTAKPASTDVTNFDLPGAAGNPVNTTPVYVFLDDLSSTASDDEGRGMCQIAYKMAGPRAAIAFGTAGHGRSRLCERDPRPGGHRGLHQQRPNLRCGHHLRRRRLLRRTVLSGRQSSVMAWTTPARRAPVTSPPPPTTSALTATIPPLRWVANGSGLTSGHQFRAGRHKY